MIEGLVPATPFVQVPPSPAADLVTHLAAFFDLAEVWVQQLLQALTTAPGPPRIPSGLLGMSLLPLAGGTCVLAHGVPGRGFPHHRCHDDEWTLVLQGWVQEEDGRWWGPGDGLHRAPGSAHALSAMEPTPGVCAIVSSSEIALVAARSEAGGENGLAGLRSSAGQGFQLLGPTVHQPYLQREQPCQSRTHRPLSRLAVPGRPGGS